MHHLSLFPCFSECLTLTPIHTTQPLSCLLFTALFLLLIHQNYVTMCFSKTINTLLNVTLPISLLATPDTMVPCHVQHYHLIVRYPSACLYVQSAFNMTFIYSMYSFTLLSLLKCFFFFFSLIPLLTFFLYTTF